MSSGRRAAPAKREGFPADASGGGHSYWKLVEEADEGVGTSAPRVLLIPLELVESGGGARLCGLAVEAMVRRSGGLGGLAGLAGKGEGGMATGSTCRQSYLESSHSQLIEGKERQAVVINQGRMIPLCVCMCCSASLPGTRTLV